MSARQLLDQLLQSGQGLLADAGSKVQGATGGKGSSFLTGLGGGALGAGALGLLLGSKKARKIGGKVAMYGGMAALGALAYRAYGDWQRKQAGAAKADGHIGPEERALLETELAKLSSDAQDRRWLETELSRPLDPAVIAQSAKTPEMAAEMYLASLLVVDEESYMERAYLDELARQLKLQPGLKEQLEQHARAAA